MTISAASESTCAFTNTGTARCWGSNAFGQLGDGSANSSSVPVSVVDPANPGSPLTGIAAVSAKGFSTCAVMNDGTAKCWGLVNSSQVPATVLDPTAQPGTPLAGVAEASVGGSHACLRLTDGTARCWGINNNGQLGNATTTGSAVPVTVVDPADTANPLTGIAAISAGTNHTCALLTTATIRCWGYNLNGQLGNNTATGSTVPVTVVDPADTANPLTGVAAVSAGNLHTCALLTAGTARCWGFNAFGQLGDNTNVQRRVPVAVVDPADTTVALAGLTMISAGGVHTCAVLTGGTARCWGYNGSNQIGDGTGTDSAVPVPVVGLG